MSAMFLDTGYVIALESTRDQHHVQATRHWRTLPRGQRFVTTSLVFAEIIAYINGHGLHAKAIAVGRRLLEDPLVELIHVDEALFQQGRDLLRRHNDKQYSLADRVSFLLMKDRGIRQALSFDRHFEQAGFERLPETTE